MNNASYKAALGGIVCSICLTLVFLAGVIPVLSLTLPLFAGLLLVVVCSEIGLKWAFLTYVSIGLLSLMLSYDKGSALFFIMLFGHYPILKQLIERIRRKPAAALMKLLVYNLCVVAIALTTVFVLGAKELFDEIAEYGKYAAVVVLALTNPVFLMYDYVITGFALLYAQRIKPKLMSAGDK